MITTTIYDSIVEAKQKGQKKFAVLIDPDKVRLGNMDRVLDLAVEAKVDYFFIGGSLVVNNSTDACIQTIKKYCDIPTVLFHFHNY